MKKTVLDTVLSTAFIVAFGFAVSACSSEKEEAGAESGKVMAVDRVDDAAEIARAKSPAAEDMAFAETAPAMPVAETDGAAVDGTTTAASETDAVMPEVTATDSADADMAVADSADMPAADTTTDAEPATN